MLHTITYGDFISSIPHKDSIPEQNHEYLNRYIDLCREYKVNSVIDQTIYIANKVALTKCWWGSTFEFPIYHQTCHPNLHYSLQDILDSSDAITKLAEQLGMPFSPETFRVSDIDVCDKKYFLPLNSRRTKVYDSEADYLASLNAKRRYKVKQVLSSTTEVSTVTVNDLDFIIPTLRSLYPDELDYQYALIQSLWGIACGAYAIRTSSALGIFIPRNNELLFQAMVQNSYTNEGAKILVRSVQLARDLGLEYVEPTCKVVLENQDIDIYKRLITNEDHNQYLMTIGTHSQVGGFKPPLCIDNIWRTV